MLIMHWMLWSGRCNIDACPNQYDQAPRGLYLPCQCQKWPPVTCASSVSLPRNLVSAAAVFVAVLGTRTVEMSATQSSIIHGPRASRLAKVS